ncbi:DUF5682 family protein [Moraxella sp. K1664]|uniref:DUF5682 family protein n=1 Tax=Moraxella sp. K1664 TaxID=2780077 RepID=UPI0018823098|nr:DUF5682 family protein [Moraxella sp. K1664]MBE9578749.1 hypothetical protein [Moraxella sp. K1664]
MKNTHSALLPKTTPKRLVHAFDSLDFLANQNIHFAPIRHHSPMCSFALMAYIKALAPTHILIEAPYTFDVLIDDLTTHHTKPPVAIFAQAVAKQKTTNKNNQEDDEHTAPTIHSAFFPFCEYSPEWIALQEGKKINSQCQFIDLDWASQSEFDSQADKQTHQKSLMQERYLAHSTYIKILAKKLHCKDHDDLWEHLFELRQPNTLSPKDFFNDVFTWCALARLDYEEEVLYQEGSLHREYCMIQKILPHIKNDNKLLIITGGFHTLSLIENLHKHFNNTPITPYAINSTYEENSWLIRYSFDRLNALNGYASGMPSPAYYQYYWQYLLSHADDNKNQDTSDNNDLAIQYFYDYVSLLCHHLNDKQDLEINPFIATKHTLEIATGLSLLRGHYYPSRYDLIDGITTALIKGDLDDGQAYLWQVVFDYLSGNQLGQVAKTQKSPALLQNTHATAQAFRFKLDDTLTKTRKLDTYRKPLHRKISQFLHLLLFLEVGFGQFVSGADFIRGVNLDLLFEEWQYAWTPSVEARLIELSEMGNDLSQLAINKLLIQKQALQKDGQLPSAHHTAELFAQACKMGLHKAINELTHELTTHLNNDSNLSSLIGATGQLFYLYQARQLIDINGDELKANILLGIRQSCYYLHTLYDTTPEHMDDNLGRMIALNKLIKNTAIYFDMPDDYLQLFYHKLSHDEFMKLELHSLAGALQTLAYLDNKIDDTQLQNAINKAFAIGTLPADSVAYLQGMFQVAPEYFIGSPVAIGALYELIKSWDNELFLSILPDLRFIFSTLTPRQSKEIANIIAKKTLIDDSDELIAVDLSINQNDMLYGISLNEKMRCLLKNDFL